MCNLVLALVVASSALCSALVVPTPTVHVSIQHVQPTADLASAAAIFPPASSTLIAAVDKLEAVRAELYGERAPGAKPLSKAKIANLKQMEIDLVARQQRNAAIASETVQESRAKILESLTPGVPSVGNPFADPGAKPASVR